MSITIDISTDDIERSQMLMRIAAEYIRKNSNLSATITYDEVQCDGYCLADDLDLQATIIELVNQ